MKQKLLYAVLLLTLASPAAAEPIRVAQASPPALPPHEVLTIIRSTGLHPLDRPVRRGPTYVLRAMEGREEVRVVVDAWDGSILSVRPMMTARASRPIEPLDPDEPYERLSPPGAIYLPPDAASRGVYRSGPPIYETEPPAIYGSRPAGRPLSAREIDRDPESLSDPQVIPAPDGSETGMLPPPPARFPQRAAPAPEPKAKPAPRRAASNVPASPPLPKPRPARPAASVPAGEAPPEASAPAALPERKSDSLPH